MLTQERLKSLLHYDKETGIFTWKKRKTSVREGSVAGHTHPNGYIRICIHGTLYSAHRLAFLYEQGAWPKAQVDHENRVRTDNRWVNLREVTCMENRRNSTLSRKNTSGYNGVTWNAAREKWVAQIKAENHSQYLGGFDEIEDAVAARREADVTYGFHPNHGERRVKAHC